MKSLKLVSLFAGLLAAASLVQAQDSAPSSLNNMILSGTITSATGGAAATGHINSLLGADGVDYTVQADGTLTDPAPFHYTKSGAASATLAENAVGALPGVSVALTFTGATAGNFTATYTGGSTQTGTFTLVPFGSAAPLINVSTLTNLDAGGSAITGFVISGTSARRILVRAVGPTLSQFGVGSPLADPSLIVWHGTQSMATNNDWDSGANVDSTLSATFGQVGAFGLPAGSKDAAIVLTLAPGIYTAQISGASASASGHVLLEVYLIQ